MGAPKPCLVCFLSSPFLSVLKVSMSGAYALVDEYDARPTCRPSASGPLRPSPPWSQRV